MKNFKKIKMNIKLFTTLVLGSLLFTFTNCAKIQPEIKGIPSDEDANPNPKITPTVMFPNFHYDFEKGTAYSIFGNYDGHTVMNIYMNGIYDMETQKWLELVGTGISGQNVWVSLDEEKKGIAVDSKTLTGNNNSENTVFDIVFLVDNSGSMVEEADAIARDIMDWTAVLENCRLDVRFGCVGYGYNSDNKIYGAINVTSADSLKKYLDRTTGLNRTVGYGGGDADMLTSLAQSYSYPGGECGVLALRFADENFSFRKSASHAYINFTDEPNQPGGSTEWSVRYVNNSANWTKTKGIIHTVYSEDTTSSNWTSLYEEKPWLLSRYTGGTEVFPPRNFNGVTLSSLPVTNALTNTEDVYTIRLVVDELMDGDQHRLKITVRSVNEKIQAEKNVFIKFVTE